MGYCLGGGLCSNASHCGILDRSLSVPLPRMGSLIRLSIRRGWRGDADSKVLRRPSRNGDVRSRRALSRRRVNRRFTSGPLFKTRCWEGGTPGFAEGPVSPKGPLRRRYSVAVQFGGIHRWSLPERNNPYGGAYLKGRPEGFGKRASENGRRGRRARGCVRRRAGPNFRSACCADGTCGADDTRQRRGWRAVSSSLDECPGFGCVGFRCGGFSLGPQCGTRRLGSESGGPTVGLAPFDQWP